MISILLEVETWAICLATLWAKKYFNKGARYHPLIIGKVVELESSDNWTHALAILNSYMSEPLPQSSSDVALGRINRWFCLQELGQESDAVMGEINAWVPQDDDAEDLLISQIGRAALLRDYSGLAILIKRGLGSSLPNLQKSFLRDAPLIKRAMRESPIVASLLQGPNVSQRRVRPRVKRHGRD
jgi:hypothetical protein